MADLAKLVVKMEAQTAQYMQQLDLANKKLDKFAMSQKKALRDINTGFKSAIGIFAVGFSLNAFISNTVKAEQSLAQLTAALKATGEAAGFNGREMAAMASELAAATTFTTEEITDAQTRLVSYTSIVGDEFTRAMKVAADQSIRLGQSFTSSAESIGRALETPSRGVASLTKQGFVFTESQRNVLRSLEAAGRMAEAQAIVLDVLEESYGGAAAAARNTFGGALTAVKNSLSTLLTAKGGLPEATSSLNQMADTFSDPQFVANINVVTTAMITGFGKAAQFMADFAGWTKYAAESLAAVAAGPAFDDLVRTENRIVKLREEIENLESLGGFDRFISGGRRVDGWIKDRRDELARLEAQYKAATKAAEALADSPRGAGGSTTTAPTGAPPPSVEFLKIEAQLREQIALYGKTGVAAKLAYQVQIGAIEGISEAEGARLVALAKQIDALSKRTEEEKAAEESQKKLQEGYESQVKALQRQIALTGEITAIQRTQYELEHGDLLALDEARKGYILTLAGELEARQRAVEIAGQVKSVTEETITAEERHAAVIEELNRLYEESNALLGEQGLSHEAYVRAIEKADEELMAATKKSNEFRLQAARETEGAIAESLLGAMDGEFKRIDKLFLAMVNRMVAHALAAQLATRLFGDVGGSGGGGAGGGGWLDSAISFAGGLFRDTGGRAYPGRPHFIGTGAQPEVFVPDTAGEFFPANQWMGGGGARITQNLFLQGSTDQRTPRQIALATERQQRIAAMKYGG